MVKVYSTPTCPPCVQLKGELDALGIKYDTKDVSTDKNALDELIRATGRMLTPTVSVETTNGTQYIVGKNLAGVIKALQNAND